MWNISGIKGLLFCISADQKDQNNDANYMDDPTPCGKNLFVKLIQKLILYKGSLFLEQLYLAGCFKITGFYKKIL